MRWDIGSTPSINRMSVLEAPLSLICIRYSRESATPNRRGGEVVEQRTVKLVVIYCTNKGVVEEMGYIS